MKSSIWSIRSKFSNFEQLCSTRRIGHHWYAQLHLLLNNLQPLHGLSHLWIKSQHISNGMIIYNFIVTLALLYWYTYTHKRLYLLVMAWKSANFHLFQKFLQSHVGNSLVDLNLAVYSHSWSYETLSFAMYKCTIPMLEPLLNLNLRNYELYQRCLKNPVGKLLCLP